LSGKSAGINSFRCLNKNGKNKEPVLIFSDR